MKIATVTTIMVTTLLINSTLFSAQQVHKDLFKPHINLGSTVKKTTPRSLPDITLEDENAASQVTDYADYLKACYLHAQGDVETSFKTYQQLMSRKASSYLYDGFFRLLFDVGQFKLVTTLFEKQEKLLTSAFTDNLDIKLILAQSYLYIEQETKAEKIFGELADQYPDNDQVAYFRALALIKSEHISDALSFLDSCIEKQTLRSKHFLFFFLKSKIYLQQNQQKDALMAIEKSLELFPKFDRGWLFKAMLQEQQGKITDAISGYQRFLDLVGREETIEKQLIQLLFTQGRYPEAATILKKIKSSQPEYYFDLALLELRSNNFEDANAHINVCLAKAPQNTKAHLLKVEILIAQQKGSDALHFLQNWFLQESANDVALHTMLLLRKSVLSTPDVIAGLEELKKKNPHNIGLLAALGDLYLEIDNPKAGLTCYQEIAAATTDRELQAKITFHRCHILFAKQQYEELENFIPQALEQSAPYPALYNLIAFYYAKTNQQLEKALTLADQALTSEATSPYYLDTKGFVLLKQGKKTEALTLLEKAKKLAPEDETIAEHVAMASQK